MIPASLQLVSLVRAVAADPDAWRPHIRYDRTTRSWSRLPAPPGIDIWLLMWLPEQGTELHDHGRSAAALTVVEGSLLNVQADSGATLSSSVLHEGDTHWLAPGVVHDVVNRSPRPAVSIHAYAPRLTQMTFWTAGPGGLLLDRRTEVTEPEVAA